MKKVYWRVRREVKTGMAKAIIAIIWIWYFIKRFIPYETAKIHMAYRLYQETTMYRDRLTGFGPDFARKSFVEYKEYRFFLHKLTRRDKVKAFFLPFNYISSDDTTL